MAKTLQLLVASMKVMAIAVILCLMAPAAKADTWRGTAPFCDGQCLPGKPRLDE